MLGEALAVLSILQHTLRDELNVLTPLPHRDTDC
jgi:hypothetical protein